MVVYVLREMGNNIYDFVYMGLARGMFVYGVI